MGLTSKVEALVRKDIAQLEQKRRMECVFPVMQALTHLLEELARSAAQAQSLPKEAVPVRDAPLEPYLRALAIRIARNVQPENTKSAGSGAMIVPLALFHLLETTPARNVQKVFMLP